MIPWRLIDTASVPGSGHTLRLYQREDEYSIRGDGFELMNSRLHGSEETLAQLACQRLADCSHPRILIGGLGMGYTLAAALKHLGANSQVVVAELLPAVVQWNYGPIGHLAGHPLTDKRVTVREIDVMMTLKLSTRGYDAIVLDVDNGPNGLTREANDWLYGHRGLMAAFMALRLGGVLAVWSSAPDPSFSQRLRQAGFEVNAVRVPARHRGGGGWHTIWLAGRGLY
jgi:spermidine synthase